MVILLHYWRNSARTAIKTAEISLPSRPTNADDGRIFFVLFLGCSQRNYNNIITARTGNKIPGPGILCRHDNNNNIITIEYCGFSFVYLPGIDIRWILRPSRDPMIS